MQKTLILALAVVTGVAMSTGAFAATKKQLTRTGIVRAQTAPALSAFAAAPFMIPTPPTGEYPWWLDQAKGNMDGF